jgi:hypothetical protein
LTILNDVVNVTANNGAGIGSGYAFGKSGASTVDDLVIESGTFQATAVGGERIGSGFAGEDYSVYNLTIQQGLFTAVGRDGAVAVADDAIQILMQVIIRGGKCNLSKPVRGSAAEARMKRECR